MLPSSFLHLRKFDTTNFKNSSNFFTTNLSIHIFDQSQHTHIFELTQTESKTVFGLQQSAQVGKGLDKQTTAYSVFQYAWYTMVARTMVARYQIDSDVRL